MSVTITGTNFGATQGASTVTFHGIAATPTSWSGTSIAAPVPVGATTGNVVVMVNGVASVGAAFTVIPTPDIGSLLPPAAAVGAPVTITGANFGATQGASTLTFNGVTATPTSWSSNSIVAPVPPGPTTGNVVVTVNGIASAGAAFTAVPVSVSPRAAAVVVTTQTQQFTAWVTSNASVTWSVDGVPGGNSTVGTISASGLYTPSSIPAMHTIQATNVSNPQQTATAFVAANNYPGTFTGRNDTLRTGQNLNEVGLTTGTVNRNQFGKLFSYLVDGYVFAQPLYVQGVSIPNQGLHNVVYVATENDSVFAFDADNNGTGGGQLWQKSFLDPANGITTVPQGEVENGNDIPVQIGITATPVIDPAAGLNGTLFVIARTKEITAGVTSYVQRLHALDMATGLEQAGSPVIVQATVSGVGIGSIGGQLSFDPLRENPRTALLLANGTVYISWASLEDILPFHGWVIGYNESTLQQSGVFNTTPNGSEGGIWQSGDGIAADANGNLFVVTSNGTFDASTGGVDYGDSVLKLNAANGVLAIADSFTPFNQASLSSLNWDLGAGGTMLLPDQPGPYPHVMLAGGKGSAIYELNRDFLGGFSATANQNLLTIPTLLSANLEASGNRGGPAYWQGQVYFVGSAGLPMQLSLQGGLISTLPIAQSNKLFGYPGGAPVVSANGNNNGIVWALQVDRFFKGSPAILRAFDAANVSRELYNSSNATRDTAGPAVKFTAPTVANGKVYVGTQTELDVYGLLQ